MKRDLFLDALQGRNEGRPPIWLMRQAGRYMPSYQKIRQKHSLLECFQQQELIEEISLLPIHELEVDAAILFSDILLPLQALGFTLVYGESGPKVHPDSFSIEEIKLPSYIEVKERFSFVTKSIQSLKKSLKVPLLGFSGAPFTLASYLFDKKNHHLLTNTKKMMFLEKEKFHKLLSILCDLNISYLKMQIEAGVDAVQIFDSWAGVLSKNDFEEFCLPYVRKILSACTVPAIFFCRGSCLFAKELATLPATGLSFDWQLPLSEIKKVLHKNTVIQGNLDPDLLMGSRESLKKETLSILEQMQGEKRFIFNLGHGVTPFACYDNVKYLVDLVKSSR